MDDTNRPQRAPLTYPYIGSFGDGLSLDGQSPLSGVDMDETWKLFGLQSPQCIGQDHLSGMGSAFRTPHDDLCAHPPKCPTTGGHFSSNSSSHNHLNTGGSGSPSHMLFHTRHFDPHSLSGSPGQQQQQQQQQQQHQQMHGLSGAGSGAYVDGLNLMDFNANSFFSHNAIQSAPSVGTPTAVKPSTYTNDFSEHLSVLSSPPTHTSMHSGACGHGAEDDADTDCDSNCDFGVVCTDSACSDNPSGCCDDEDCLQESSPASGSAAITTEDAIAAAALTSFVEQQQQQHQQRQRQQQQQQQQAAAVAAASGMHAHHNHQHSDASNSGPACLQFGLGPDMCISPQFLINYQHLREAHNPLNPSECTASFCPVDDPKFYEECHIRHVPDSQGGLFDNIDLNLMMNETAGHGHVHTHNHNHVESIECGAKFPNSEAMVEHLWNEHRKSLALLQQFPMSLDQVPAMNSSAASSVSLSSQDLAKTPSLSVSGQVPVTGLSLPDASLPLGFGFDHGNHHGHHGHFHGLKGADTQQQLQNPAMALPQTKLGGLKTETGQQSSGAADGSKDQGPQVYECLWCDTVGGQQCGQIYDSAGELHKHVLAAHTHQLKRDVGGTYSCGWLGCNRRDCEEKGGFAQKSKIDRHMQVHTGNKPFTCDICHQSFSANQALLQHKLIHEDSKPLSCDICGKTFRQHSALTMHIRTHTKVRPLKCPYCNKEFSESSNLSKHKRIHTGDGQYECKFPGCNRTFHRKDQLRRHSTQHSKGNTPSTIGKPSTSSNLALSQVAV
ncbi:zinc-finger protein [Sporothrix bragantina]|uniref:Zinc-finger protein n=1 Tax=Sporothrix bragantina TaxID=671064 RepID=A0ABP0AVB9_9PEZI